MALLAVIGGITYCTCIDGNNKHNDNNFNDMMKNNEEKQRLVSESKNEIENKQDVGQYGSVRIVQQL